MTKKMIVIAVIAVFAGSAIVMRSLARIAHASTRMEDDANPAGESRWINIEAKSKEAETGDSDSVRSLAGEVFSQPHRFGTLPTFVKQPIEEHVVQAELDYRIGMHKAITHGDVARVINSLSDKLGLPEYTKTNEKQVLEMRFRAVQLTPHFMGKGLSKSEDGTQLTRGDSINSAMSPLQASYLVMFAVDAKLGNPEYQVTPTEWERRRYQKDLQTFQRHKNERESGNQNKTEEEPDSLPRLVALGSKRMEVVRAAEAHLLKLSPEESVNLARGALETLGIAPSH